MKKSRCSTFLEVMMNKELLILFREGDKSHENNFTLLISCGEKKILFQAVLIIHMFFVTTFK